MYKRNQLEEAILRAERLDPATEGAETRIRIKRLLDLDRKQAPGPEKLYGTTYAFYGSEAPGTGFEVLFSPYEIFALWVGLRLLAAGFPQGRVVFLMRYYRKALENEHRRILKTDLARLFARSFSLRRSVISRASMSRSSAGRRIQSVSRSQCSGGSAAPSTSSNRGRCSRPSLSASSESAGHINMAISFASAGRCVARIDAMSVHNTASSRYDALSVSTTCCAVRVSSDAGRE